MRAARDTRRDVYANLLRDTRAIRRDHASARDTWFASLPWERKEDTLFELEMLLKGIACFGNPRNHPGPPRRTPAVAQDFHEEMHTLRDAVSECIQLIRALLGEKDRAYQFSRYLETVIPEDAVRSRLVREQLTQDTPQEALFLLRNNFTAYVELIDGLLKLGRVSHKLYFAMHGTLTREIGRNAFFNPLTALEFRSELDRIRNPEVLEALEIVPSEAAHRVAALAFLALFRALRYVALIERYAAEPACVRLTYVLISVLRSDIRALTHFLGQRAGEVMADGFEAELLGVSAREVITLHGELSRVAGVLVSLRGAFEATANTLGVEIRKALERDLPAADSGVPAVELGPQMIVAAAELRASLEHAIHTLCAEIRPGEPAPELTRDEGARRAASERLRRDVWMFAQVLRAFLAKARAAGGDQDLWAAQARFHFVREFLGHFRAIGYQLVRSSDYDRLDPFLETLEALRDADILDPDRLSAAIRECQELFDFLQGLFSQISKRAELRDAPFDKRSAADTLKMYLGAA